MKRLAFILFLMCFHDSYVIADEPAPSKKSYDVAVRTNMLYDALAVPNVGVEIYMPHDWSLAGSLDYAWWTKHSQHRSWRFMGVELDLRRWLGGHQLRTPYTGHHVGLYTQLYTYDFALGRHGYLGGIPKGFSLEHANYSFGLEYGYTLPLNTRLRLDLNLGLGYMGGTYQEYYTKETGDVWLDTKKRNWIGPTKAEVALVWLIGKNISNTHKKGGRR